MRITTKAQKQRRYYPVGDEGNYVRVDLSVILDGLISPEEYLDAFVRSANNGVNLRKRFFHVYNY